MANNVGANIVGANNVWANIVSAKIVGANNVGANNVLNMSTLNAKKREEKKQTICGCYKIVSTDARFGGLCYCCCPAAHIDEEVDEKRCDCCPKDFCHYWNSGYVQTTSGYGNYHDEKNGLCCWFCFPVKFPIFFPCFLGSLVNQGLNSCCKSCCGIPIKRNYLF